MTYATTFSGIGGWELGLNVCGWDLQWQCEYDPFCQILLREKFGVPVYGDIRTLAEANPSKVDALIGSAPCTPFSTAGDQLGTADERHLFPSFLRAVRLLKPRWVLMEQVAAILSMDGGRAFGEYIGGLAALGFDLVWHCLPACTVGAPHERDRVWIIAYAESQRRKAVLRRIESLCRVPHEGWPSAPLDSRRSVIERMEERLGEPAIFGSYDGLPAELALASYGNAVVPQIPYLIGQAINEVESNQIA